MHFDLTDLRLFLHVAETGSITAGAARSGLSLAAASARVRGMEVQTAVPLLERCRRGVEPTPAGRTLLHHARLVTGQVEIMRGELGEFARGLKGHVRLFANTSTATEFLPEILASFLAANPNVDVDLHERISAEVARSERLRGCPLRCAPKTAISIVENAAVGFGSSALPNSSIIRPIAPLRWTG
jgi:DNA-binding transcriptional LysR family regulator